MNETRICDNCMMDFDWKGVQVGTYDYCCDACSKGQECTCPQHDHSGDATRQDRSGERMTARTPMKI